MDTAAPLRHRLLAILAADGAGYSRLMSIDEPATVAALDAARDAFRTEIEAAAGRVIDTAGDSVLAVFETAAAAVRAALSVQSRLAQVPSIAGADEPLRFRVGLHLGDVYEKDDGTVYGDGVNIAARLEALAEPGGIAVSESIRSAVQGRAAATFEDIGDQAVKNIAAPVRVYRMRAGFAASCASGPPHARTRRRRAAWFALAATVVILVTLIAGWSIRSNKSTAEAVATKSLAVLPFAEVSEAAGSDLLAEGISEELLGLLARVPGLRVVSRNSSLSVKGQTLPAPEIARRLGVSFLVEGSVRRAGDRVRLAAQLTRGLDGSVLWSQTFDREYRDLLATQAELALQIADQLRLPLDRTSLAGSGTLNVEAWHLVLEGERKPLAEREPFYRRALALDPNFVRAHLQLASDAIDSSPFVMPQRRGARDRAVAHIETALRLDPRSAEAYGLLAYAEWLVKDYEAMHRHAKRALELDPNNTRALTWAGEFALASGDMDQALSLAGRLPIADPLDAHAHWTQAKTLRWAGRPGAALAAIEQTFALIPQARRLLDLKGHILADLGRLDEAREVARQVDDIWLSSRLANPDELALLGSRTDLNSHERAVVDLALGRHDAFVSHLDGHLDDLYWWGQAMFDPQLDPVRKRPAFVDWLERCKLTQAHERAQAWRKANPPAGR